MKPIATDIYTFANLVEGGYSYVDKTAHLHELIAGRQGKQFFMARPRRFGKSLTVSTLQAIFEVRRELFKGLAIDRSDYDWKKFPVIRLDMSTTPAETVEEFREKINELIRENQRRLGLSFERSPSADVNFKRLIEEAAASTEAGQVVLLVDEYDKPLLGHLGRETVESFRTALKSFYSVIKATEGVQRFTFITGVSKFSKVSIFSDLNNLTDLTMDAKMATLCGYTHEEVKANFSEHLVALGKANHLTTDEAFAHVLKMYDGYRFEENAPRVVNPVSLGRCLNDLKFKSYWYETGTPTFLVEMLKKRPVDISDVEVPESALGTYEPANPSLIPLLYQTGYLTIKDFKVYGETRCYRLGFPNDEVASAFSESLAHVYAGADDPTYDRVKIACWKALDRHDLDDFFDNLKTIFASIPYDLTGRQNEQTWQAILVVIMRFLGLKVIPESRTNKGRIDFVIEFKTEIYVVEMKLDRTAQEALDQIRKSDYAAKYRASGKRLTLLGINFSSKTREIDDWLVEEAGSKEARVQISSATNRLVGARERPLD